ncbi:MAG: acyltransferase family protein [Sphingobium sp.]
MNNSGAATGERLDWIDVARGAGIVAVVLSHMWTQGAMRDAMYSFHMPLFFLLSGLLARPRPIADFTVRQLAGQMRPYAAFLALLILVDQVVEPLKGGVPIFRHWPADLVPILLGGTWLHGPYTIFWFVPCLMVARIGMNLFMVRWPDLRSRAWWGIALILLALGYAVGAATDVSPLGLLTVPMAMFLLWLGAAVGTKPLRPLLLLPLVPLSLAGLAGLWPTLNVKAGDYGWPLLSIASAIATSILLLYLSRKAAPWAGWLGAIGRASLVIMYLHVALIHYGQPYLGKPVLAALALLIPFAYYHLLRAVPPLRRLFL